MKKNVRRTNKSLLSLLMIILVIAILGVVGYFGYTLVKPNQSINKKILGTSCGEYDKFVNLTKELVASSVDSTDSFSEESEDFLWKRSSQEPMVGYPSTHLYSIFQPNKNIMGNASAFDNAESVSAILSKNLKQNAEQLGLTVDQLNTSEIKEIGGTLHQRFGFSKQGDFYLVQTDYSPNYGGLSGLIINIFCAKPVQKYDALYDLLNMKVKAAITSDYYDYPDYININEFSSDNSVFVLFGSRNYVDIANYYYSDGKSVKLISSRNSPAKCSVLESQKLGKGLWCTEERGNRKVNY